MKLIWYLISITIICLVLISSPKAPNIGSFSNQGSLLNTTRSTQRTLQGLIACNILCFLILTTWLLIHSVA
uniref:Probable protein-export membrane protein SecG n=1 Tax=Sarcopeltis skottsbergii TaxID=2765380 RepID=A0A7M3VH65_SARSK|nr:preprotein translocase subunit G [Sarcopeltis skottsbergii]